MMHVVRRFLPLLLGPLGGLVGSLTGFVLHQLLCRSLRMLWQPYLGWQWIIGLLAYPLLGLLVALPFLAVYPGELDPFRSRFGRSQDAHLRTWIAILFATYLPVGIAVVYSRWWNAPAFPIPFTDSYIYSGGRGDILVALCAVTALGSFCGIGVERLSRGVPRPLRLLLGPPLATALAMAASLGISLGAGGLVAAGPDRDPFGPLLQPFNQVGWDSNLLLSVHTVVAGGLAGTLAMLTVALPVLQGIPDVHPRASRRRWALPMVAVAVSGALALLALAQGHGLDSLRWNHTEVLPGTHDIVGNLVAPADSDVLVFEAERDGFYLLEFPSPDLRGRHQVVLPGHPIPTPDAQTLRYLVEGSAAYGVQEIQVMASWPPRTGVSSYSGQVRFEYAGEPGSVFGPARLDAPTDGLAQWKGDVRRGPMELTLSSPQATYWTIFAPRAEDGLGWWWEQGWSAVTVTAMVEGELLFKRLLDQEGFGLNSMTMLVGSGDGVAPPPEITLRIQPSRQPQGNLWLPVVAEGLCAGDAVVHSTLGPSFLGVASDEEFTLYPTPGGTLSRLAVVSLDGDTAEMPVSRRHDDGIIGPAGDTLLMLGSTHLRVEGAGPDSRAVLALSGQGGTRSMLWEN